jgi:hypothetical protein
MAKKKISNHHYVSKCRNHILRGNAKQLVEKYTELAKTAKDEAQRHVFLNHIEHYSKVIEGPRV